MFLGQKNRLFFINKYFLKLNYLFLYQIRILLLRMRKISFVIVAIAVFLFIGNSCDNQKTYAEYLKEESKGIKQFIAENELVVLDEYPEDHVFKPNEFYRDPATGVYYNVIDSGGRKATFGEEVYIRFKGLTYFLDGDTTQYANILSPDPEILVYGNPTTYSCNAWVVPLGHVGHLGRVKLIVPFNQGLTYDKSYYRTAYYENLQYRIENPNPIN